MAIYIEIFLICGVIGWVLDTGYRSLEARRYIAGTLLPVFSIVFGAGAVLLYLVYTQFSFHPIVEIFIGTLAVTFLEYFSGQMCYRWLQKRLWNYKPNPYDLHGHIDLLHSFYWLILSGLFYFVLTKLSLL